MRFSFTGRLILSCPLKKSAYVSTPLTWEMI